MRLSELKTGMTVYYKGELLTVGKNDVKFNELFGYSFRGDGSNQYITRVQFSVPTSYGIRLE